jgi:hypothetical protein
MSDENAGAAAATVDKDIYTDFDAFLKQAIHDYYKASGKKHKANFVALLIASGEGPSLALDSIKSGAGTKKLALGAAGLLALRIGLRYALSGPLGIVLAAATAASLIAYFVRNRGEIVGRISRNRQMVAELRRQHEQFQSDLRDGRVSEQQRNLMLDGLMKRFLADLDA